MAAQLDPVIGEAANVAMRWSADDQFRFEMEMLEKAERDYYSGLNQAHKQGHAEGLEQGKAEGLEQGRARERKAIDRALAKGLSREEVADLFDISLEEVAQAAG